MKYLFYFYSCFNSTMMGGLVDEAMTLAESEFNEVLFVYCGGVNETCIVINPNHSKPLCHFCTKCTRKVLKQYGIKSKSLSDFADDLENNIRFEYDSLQDIKSIEYRGIKIGLSIASNYISTTRNMNPLMDGCARRYFDRHLSQNVHFVDAIYHLFDSFQPDVVYSFNGRFEEVRPIFDICKLKSIHCVLSEVIKKDGNWYKVRFEDKLPHDIKYNVERRNYCWDNYNLSDDEKNELGNSFYHKRRHGEESGDKLIYVANQIEGNYNDFDSTKINIAIFNSSEDEFAAVGGDWESLKLFSSQYEGIVYLLKHADPSIHFYLRVHPNLKNIKYRYHTDLYDLRKEFSNITIIPANSNVSTYTIMEHCDKIVCFGSTMGIEGTYWGVPSILLGPSIYYYDGVAYTPKSKEEAISLLNKKLAPLRNENLIRFGAYILNREPLICHTKYINCDSHDRKLFGIKYTENNFLSFRGNVSRTALYIALRRFIFGIRIFGNAHVPLKEA